MIKKLQKFFSQKKVKCLDHAIIKIHEKTFIKINILIFFISSKCLAWNVSDSIKMLRSHESDYTKINLNIEGSNQEGVIFFNKIISKSKYHEEYFKKSLSRIVFMDKFYRSEENKSNDNSLFYKEIDFLYSVYKIYSSMYDYFTDEKNLDEGMDLFLPKQYLSHVDKVSESLEAFREIIDDKYFFHKIDIFFNLSNLIYQAKNRDNTFKFFSNKKIDTYRFMSYISENCQVNLNKLDSNCPISLDESKILSTDIENFFSGFKNKSNKQLFRDMFLLISDYGNLDGDINSRREKLDTEYKKLKNSYIEKFEKRFLVQEPSESSNKCTKVKFPPYLFSIIIEKGLEKDLGQVTLVHADLLKSLSRLKMEVKEKFENYNKLLQTDEYFKLSTDKQHSIYSDLGVSDYKRDLSIIKYIFFSKIIMDIVEKIEDHLNFISKFKYIKENYNNLIKNLIQRDDPLFQDFLLNELQTISFKGELFLKLSEQERQSFSLDDFDKDDVLKSLEETKKIQSELDNKIIEFNHGIDFTALKKNQEKNQRLLDNFIEAKNIKNSNLSVDDVFFLLDRLGCKIIYTRGSHFCIKNAEGKRIGGAFKPHGNLKSSINSAPPVLIELVHKALINNRSYITEVLNLNFSP